MKKGLLWVLALLLAFGFVAAFATCGGGGDDDDDGGDDDTADDDTSECDVHDVCDYIFDNNCDNNWGWESREQCYDLFMEGCKDVEAYYDCVCPCVNQSENCDEFKACEFACWDNNCE